MRAALLATALLVGCASVPGGRADLPPEAELVVIRTQDGVDLPAIHYRAVGAPRPRPLVLCHGLSGNARHMDLDANHSLARWFAQRGFDTWALSLRGTWSSALPSGSQTESKIETTVDVYATQDLPAVFDFVRARTGAAQVDFVGHSMGGLILYAYLARGGEAVHTAVTLGSPAELRFGGALEGLLGGWVGHLVTGVGSVPNDLLADAYVAPHGAETELELLLLNPDNVTESTWHELLAEGTAPMAGGVLRQLERCVGDGRFTSSDGSIDYLRALGQVRVPILFVAGKVDRLAMPDGVKATYQALGGEKAFFIAGEENGFAHDYGHLDLIIAERAPLELWPRIEEWLAQHGNVHGASR